jgi:hypothetical protein
MTLQLFLKKPLEVKLDKIGQKTTGQPKVT